MNFFDFVPEYCLTKKITATQGYVGSELTQKNVSTTESKIYEFVSLFDGTANIILSWSGGGTATVRIDDNDVTIRNASSTSANYGVITLTRGHHYKIYAKMNQQAATCTLSIGAELKDDVAFFFK